MATWSKVSGLCSILNNWVLFHVSPFLMIVGCYECNIFFNFFVSASSDCSELPEWSHRSAIVYYGSVAIPGSVGPHLYHNTGDW